MLRAEHFLAAAQTIGYYDVIDRVVLLGGLDRIIGHCVAELADITFEQICNGRDVFDLLADFVSLLDDGAS